MIYNEIALYREAHSLYRVAMLYAGLSVVIILIVFVLLFFSNDLLHTLILFALASIASAAGSYYRNKAEAILKELEKGK